jgi:hypothetical protein
VTAAGVALAVLEDRNAFAPTGHIWMREKINWVKLTACRSIPRRFPCDTSAALRAYRSVDPW